MTHNTERVRPDHAQACRRGEGQAVRDAQASCFQHAQVDFSCVGTGFRGTRYQIWAGDLCQWACHCEVDSCLRVQRDHARGQKSRRSWALDSDNQWRLFALLYSEFLIPEHSVNIRLFSLYSLLQHYIWTFKAYLPKYPYVQDQWSWLDWAAILLQRPSPRANSAFVSFDLVQLIAAKQ